MEKRHRMMDMCKSLCIADGHFYKCPYRQQSDVKEPIIAGSHNHVLTGMMSDKFDVVIIDEFPVSAVLRETHIAPHKILSVQTEDEVVSKLLYKLAIMGNNGGTFSGYDLLKEIAPELRHIFSKVETTEDVSWLFQSPELLDVEDVEEIRYDYLKEFLQVILPEFRAYESGEFTDWLSRVVIDGKGIHLYSRNVLWEALRESKIIILDATGMKRFYDTILSKDVRVVDTPVRGNGRIFQVTTRSWGISSVLDNGKITPQGQQLLTLIEYISKHKPLETGGFAPYKSVGIVSFKGLKPYLVDKGFSEERLMHLGGSRGSNKFVGNDLAIDCVIVAGTLSASDEDLIRMYAQLYYEPENPVASRIQKPEKQLNSAGFSTYRIERTVHYPYVDENGKQPCRIVSGFADDDLQTLYEQLTYAEITQSIGRARLKTDEGKGRDVFVLSSVPPKDYSIIHKIVDDLSDLYPLPENVSWWKWMDFIKIIYDNSKGIDLTNLARLANVSRPTMNKYLRYFLLTSSEEFEVYSDDSDRRRKILRKRRQNSK
jgi:hypothetical protein